MEAAPGNIIVEERQARTARDSFVMTSHPSERTAAASTSICLQNDSVNVSHGVFFGQTDFV
jgi:hypothetical protein